MAALTLWRCDSGRRVLGGWGPLLCVVLGSLVVLLMPLIGLERPCCVSLRGVTRLRCQLWGASQSAPAVQSTSLAVPFTDLDLLPQKTKPSKGTERPNKVCFTFNSVYASCSLAYCHMLKKKRS